MYRVQDNIYKNGIALSLPHPIRGFSGEDRHGVETGLAVLSD